MSEIIPFHKHTVGRTFMIAITVLGIGALVQFSAMTWLFFTRYRANGPVDTVTALATPAVPAREFADPFADSTPAAANLPAATPPPKPTPVPVQETRAQDPAPADRLTELIDQGRTLRDRGDTYASVTKLREAEAMADQNPLPTAELAMTYEKMGFTEKASECWKRIYEMGASAGVYFAAAEGRLKASQQAALKEAAPGEAPAAGGEASAPAATAPAKGDVGLGPQCKLGLAEITREDQSDAAAKKKFVLHVPVRAKARARIDVHDVIVQVVFYDIVNGKALDRTNATVSYKWSKPPADWADDDVEVLDVSYLLPELRVSDEDRKYYGYLVTVYYKNALQDYRSDPPEIARKVQPAVALAQEPP